MNEKNKKYDTVTGIDARDCLPSHSVDITDETTTDTSLYMPDPKPYYRGEKKTLETCTVKCLTGYV